MKNIIALLLISVCATAQNIPFYGNLTPADSTGYDLGRSSLHWDTVYYNVLIPAVGSASDTSLWQRLGLTRIEPKGQRSVTIDKNLTVGDVTGSDSITFAPADSNSRLLGQITFGLDTAVIAINGNIFGVGNQGSGHWIKRGDVYYYSLSIYAPLAGGTLYEAGSKDFTTGQNVTLGITDSAVQLAVLYPDSNAVEQSLSINSSGHFLGGDIVPSAERILTIDNTGKIDTSINQWQQTNTGTSEIIYPSDTNTVIIFGTDTPIIDIGTRGIQGRGYVWMQSPDGSSVFNLNDASVLIEIDSLTISPQYSGNIWNNGRSVRSTFNYGINGSGVNYASTGVYTGGGTELSELSCREDGIYFNPSEINNTASDADTINAVIGRFRKDNSGATFTLTNSYITANSFIFLTPANAAIDGTATTWTYSASSGSATITFNAAPTSNFDMNFLIIE